MVCLLSVELAVADACGEGGPFGGGEQQDGTVAVLGVADRTVPAVEIGHLDAGKFTAPAPSSREI